MPCNCPPKPWLSIEQQIRKLQSRGLLIKEDAKTINELKHFGYYRLSGYSYPLREINPNSGQRLNSFLPGSSFDYVIELYKFDKKLRLFILDALEKIEISLRASVSYGLGEKDPLFYRDINNFREQMRTSKYLIWKQKLEEKKQKSKEDCIKHNIAKYGDSIPVWVICQTWDFGQLSWLLQMLTPDNVKLVARDYGFRGHQHFLSWLTCFNELRNICAHHSRLWNRKFSFSPKRPTKQDLDYETWWDPLFWQPYTETLFFRACGIVHFLNFIEYEDEWTDRFKSFMKTFPAKHELGVTIGNLGFPTDWEKRMPSKK